MKKSVSVLLSAVLILTLIACSLFMLTVNKPEDTVTAYIEAVKGLDFKAADSCYYAVEQEENQITDGEIKLFNALYKNLEYEILSVKAKGETAAVTVKLTRTDFDKATERWAAEAENGISVSNYTDTLVKYLEADNAEKISAEVDVKCIRIKSKWYLSAKNDKLTDFLFNPINDAV